MIVPSTPRIPVGISACLMGETVRYDGRHKYSTYCNEVLSQYFDWLPFCPEMAIGLGAPRPPIRLVGEPSALRAIQGTETPRDVTGELAGYANHVHANFPQLCGYIFTERSPSCGVFRVRAYNNTGRQINDTSRGIFAKRLMELWPGLPVEESERLNDKNTCENFIGRVQAWHAKCANVHARKPNIF